MISNTKKHFLAFATIIAAVTFTSKNSYATDSGSQAPAASAPSDSPTAAPATEPYKALSWSELLQQKYQVTNEQLKALEDAKLTDSQKAMLLQLSKSSGKTVEEVLAAREGGKKGWGALAKQFGVEEKSLGQAVSEMMKLRNEERKKERESKKQIAIQKREEKRAAYKKERQEKLEAAKKERDEKRAADKKAREEKLAAEKAEREKRREEDKIMKEEMKKERERKNEERKEKQREKREEKKDGHGKADK